MASKDKAYTKKQADIAQQIVDERDPKVRWRLAADLAADMSPLVKKEQDQQKKALAKVRKENIYRKTRGKGQLRFSVSIPPLTYKVLCKVDTRFENPEKQKGTTKSSTNSFVQDLMEVFPEYRMFDDAAAN